MSDQPVSLELLSRLVRDMQEDQRELRGELNALRMRLSGLGTAVLAGIGELAESVRRLERMLTELLNRSH